MRSRIRSTVFAAAAVALVAPAARAFDDPPRPAEANSVLPADVVKQAQRAIDRGLEFLKSRQDRRGGWSTTLYGPAVTAIVARAFAQDGDYGPKHPIVERAVGFALQFEQADGGIYDKRQNLANYQTSVVLGLLASLNDPAHKDRIARTQAYLTKLQYDASESIDENHAWYGGAGYNETKRPDLSNTQMMLEALHDSGLPRDHPVYQRALTFVTRCQMNATTNDRPYAKGATSGGFIYSPNENGESKASEGQELPQSRLIPYGSMTYAGFKSMLYAGVNRDDDRVKACVKWIRSNYTLDVNPGMRAKQEKEGLYYYYHVFARALAAWGEPVIVDDKGTPHNWRLDLCRKLIALQHEDGSWENPQTRWLEGDANYVTALSIQSLQAALAEPPAAARPAPAPTGR